MYFFFNFFDGLYYIKIHFTYCLYGKEEQISHAEVRLHGSSSSRVRRFQPPRVKPNDDIITVLQR